MIGRIIGRGNAMDPSATADTPTRWTKTGSVRRSGWSEGVRGLGRSETGSTASIATTRIRLIFDRDGNSSVWARAFRFPHAIRSCARTGVMSSAMRRTSPAFYKFTTDGSAADDWRKGHRSDTGVRRTIRSPPAEGHPCGGPSTCRPTLPLRRRRDVQTTAMATPRPQILGRC